MSSANLQRSPFPDLALAIARTAIGITGGPSLSRRPPLQFDVSTNWPRRALETYEEAIAAITSVPQNNSATELRSVLLSDASVALRSLHKDGQARAWLDQATALADGLRKEHSSAAVDCDDAISRAEADWAIALGRPGEAAGWHRRFIAEAEGTSPLSSTLRNR